MTCPGRRRARAGALAVAVLAVSASALAVPVARAQSTPPSTPPSTAAAPSTRVPARATAPATTAPATTTPTTVLTPAAGAPRPTTRPLMHLTAQTGELSGDGVFRVAVSVEGIADRAPGSLEVAATLYRRVTSRRDLRRAFDATGLDSVLAVAAQPVPAQLVPGVNTDSAGRALLWVDLRIGSCVGCTTLGAAGVYPVRIDLRQALGGRVLSSFVTTLIRSTGPVRNPLQVGLVVPFHRSPSEQHGGALATLASPLAMVADRVAAHPTVRLTLLPTPETVDTLRRDVEGGDPQLIGRLKAAIGDREVLSGPYVQVAERFLDDPTYADEIDQQLAAGHDALVDALGVEPLDGVLVVRDGNAVPGRRALERLGVQRLVVTESALATATRAASVHDQPVTYDPGASEGVTTPAVPALVVDPDLAAHLTRPASVPVSVGANETASAAGITTAAAGDDDDPVLRSHHLLAELVLVQQEAPAQSRGLTIVTPIDDMTNSSLDALFGALESTSFLRSATLSDLFALPAATTADGGVVIRQAKAAPPRTFTAADTRFSLALRETRQRVEGYIGLFDRTPALATRLRRELLLSLADGLPDSSSPQSLVSRTRAQVDAQLGRVSVRPRQSYRLLDRKAAIPVTISNGFGVPVKVRATLQSDRIEFPESPSVQPGQRFASITRPLVLGERSTTERFTISTRSSGRFPLTVIVSTPNGVVLSRARYTVRSSAASGVGVVLTVGALGFLAVWWGRHIVRSRRLRAKPRHPAATNPS